MGLFLHTNISLAKTDNGVLRQTIAQRFDFLRRPLESYGAGRAAGKQLRTGPAQSWPAARQLPQAPDCTIQVPFRVLACKCVGLKRSPVYAIIAVQSCAPLLWQSEPL